MSARLKEVSSPIGLPGGFVPPAGHGVLYRRVYALTHFETSEDSVTDVHGMLPVPPGRQPLPISYACLLLGTMQPYCEDESGVQRLPALWRQLSPSAARSSGLLLLHVQGARLTRRKTCSDACLLEARKHPGH